jgi:hypothetical protein
LLVCSFDPFLLAKQVYELLPWFADLVAASIAHLFFCVLEKRDSFVDFGFGAFGAQQARRDAAGPDWCYE